ncbi:hypothetical protein [Chitinophaga agri]|uniref:Uncharacterized protein n=1 Tax=Chitinophaga agri TaxID=2703787 RepID=A0A6B9ZMS1_9BACT|nr:hypothetical protein [Chitinophaga agri]QHS63548.1 hypothetical protein GWR21_29390 [Chitinophaga agri]
MQHHPSCFPDSLRWDDSYEYIAANTTQPLLLLAFRPSAAVYEMPVTYRATPGLGIYTGCLGCLSLVSVLTIGIQTYRTAVMNPVETLRQE